MRHAKGHTTHTAKLGKSGEPGRMSRTYGVKSSAASKGCKRDGHQGCGVC